MFFIGAATGINQSPRFLALYCFYIFQRWCVSPPRPYKTSDLISSLLFDCRRVILVVGFFCDLNGGEVVLT